MIEPKKKSTKIYFLGSEIARWGGGLPLAGVVLEEFVPSLESLSSLGFEGGNPRCPGNFAGSSRTPAMGVFKKVWPQRNCVHVLGPKDVIEPSTLKSQDHLSPH